jgi:hypothetical protein
MITLSLGERKIEYQKTEYNRGTSGRQKKKAKSTQVADFDFNIWWRRRPSNQQPKRLI